MNRKHNFCLLACLLALLHMASQAQNLTGYEYWFDGKVSSRVSESLSGDEAVINTKISTQHLSAGLHTLHLRFKQSGGEYNYSPVTSQLFFNHNVEEGGTVEYWFDSDIDKRATVPLPSAATDETVDVALIMTDAMKFPLGFHQLNMRVATEGKSLSNIYTAYVLKVPSGDIDALEYWVDEDFDNRQIVEGHIASSDENADIFVTPFDLSNVSSGPHRVYFRPASKEGNAVGPVSMATVIVGGGTPSRLEYWFDNNVTQKASVALPASAMQNLTDVALVMNNAEKFPLGMHLLNMRLVTEGREQSPIYSARVMKNASGEIDVIEYWVDDNYENPRTITGHVASTDENAYVFTNSFDLHDTPEGFHRIYYRGTSASGNANTAVSMTPVMVKSRYDIDPADVKMTKYSIAVDNEQPMVLDVLTPKETITIPYTLDARYLSKGNHTLKAKFWNSLGAGVSTEQQFTVADVAVPAVTLTIQEQDGLVLLKYNAVPNDIQHRILRVDENGTRTKVYESLYSCFTPTYGNSYTDTPPAGSYIYYVQTKYEDYNGIIHTVKSNEVAVNVSKSQVDNENCGYIVGMLQQNFVSSNSANIIFSDGVCEPCIDGKFHREKIPVGTVLTLEVEEGTNSSLALHYDPVTITIKKGENFVYIKGQSAEDMAPNNFAHDLVFDSDLQWIGSKFTFLVKNWTKKTWKGYVRLRAISEKEAKEEESGNNNGNNSGNDGSAVVPGSVASMPIVENNYYYCMSDELTIGSGESAPVTLNLENIFPDNKKEYYVMYIESMGKWSVDVDNGMEIKPVAINYDYNITENPMTRLIDKSYLSKAEDLEVMEMVESAANLILMVTGKVKAFDGILGNIQEFSEAMIEKTKKMGNMSFTLDSYNAYLEYAFETESFTDLLQDDMVKLIPQAVIGQTGTAITKKLREDIKSDILSSAWDKVTLKDIIKGTKFINEYLGKAMAVLKYIDKYKQWDRLNTYEKHFYCVDAILNYTEQWNPFSKVLKTYADVGKAMIYKALEYGETYYQRFQAQYLYDNIPSANERDKFEYNKFVDFKIEVQTNRLVYYNFYVNGTYQIKDVKVMLTNNKDASKVDIICFEPVGVWDGVMLKQVRYIGSDPASGGGNIDFGFPLKRMWMEIEWRNGRKSKVPLITDNSCDGVDFRNSPNNTYRYTVKFKSGTTRYENIADIIELKN